MNSSSSATFVLFGDYSQDGTWPLPAKLDKDRISVSPPGIQPTFDIIRRQRRARTP